MENREYLNSLFDIYKELLTEVEQITFTSYYADDLSLNEIAQNREVSKSSVGKTLKSAENKLLGYEKVLHNYDIRNNLRELLTESNFEKIKLEIIKILEK